MGARRATPGTRQLNLEVCEKLFAELEAFIESRGQSKRFAVEKALRRHLDSPPPVLPDPPLPPCEPDPAPVKKPTRGRAKRK